MTNVYKRIAIWGTEKFIKKGIINSEKREVYTYGFEILLSTIAYFLIFLTVSIITKTTLLSLVFLSGFYVIRTIAGGYHANTYTSCHLLFLGNHLIFITIIKIIPELYKPHFSSAFLLIAGLIILILAPVDHPNKPFNKREKVHFRKISCIYAIVLVILAVTILLLRLILNGNYSLSFAIGSISAAISLMVAKIKYIGGAKKL